MTALTLRLEDTLARRLDKACRENGYNKTGLIKKLIKDFLGCGAAERIVQKPVKKDIRSLVGIIRLGGDSVVDADSVFE